MFRTTRDELSALAAPRSELVVSVYVPLERAYPASEQNERRVGLALDHAEERLRRSSMELDATHEFVAAAREWVACVVDRPVPPLGVAMLVETGHVHTYELPFACVESVDVGRQFHLSPLVRLLSWPAEFLLLALSSHAVRLFHCSPITMTPVDLPPKTPRSLEEFLQNVGLGPTVRFQTAAGVKANSDQVIVHGGTSMKDVLHEKRHEFVQSVAKHVSALTTHESIPLVLAAVSELHAMFRSAYPGDNLIEPGVHGSPDGIEQAELWRRATCLIDPEDCGTVKQLLDRLESAIDSPKSSLDAAHIVRAAAAGQVDSLFAASEERLWGCWDGRASVATLTGEQLPGGDSIDLIDQALAETLRHGGNVCVVPRSYIPDDAKLAAVLRWAT
jgi:hypothetical protein